MLELKNEYWQYFFCSQNEILNVVHTFFEMQFLKKMTFKLQDFLLHYSKSKKTPKHFFSCSVKLFTHIFKIGGKSKARAEASVRFLLLAKWKIVNNKHILTLAAYTLLLEIFVMTVCFWIWTENLSLPLTGKYCAAPVIYIGTSLFQIHFIEDNFLFYGFFLYTHIPKHICIYMYIHVFIYM